MLFTTPSFMSLAYVLGRQARKSRGSHCTEHPRLSKGTSVDWSLKLRVGEEDHPIILLQSNLKYRYEIATVRFHSFKIQ
jgi:hypothetical protein